MTDLWLGITIGAAFTTAVCAVVYLVVGWWITQQSRELVDQAHGDVPSIDRSWGGR